MHGVLMQAGREHAGSALVPRRCAIACGRHLILLQSLARAGRLEFLRYLPENTQGVLVQPAGEHGLLVAATDTQRGFGRLDQARSWDALHLLILD